MPHSPPQLLSGDPPKQRLETVDPARSRNSGNGGPRNTQSLWFLSGQVGENEAIRHVPIHSFPFRVGRRHDFGLTLSYRTVSGVHAEIIEKGGLLFLRDLDSTNGTFVNGVRTHGDVLLKQSDLVQFADVPFRVRRHVSEKNELTLATHVCDYALALVQLDHLMSTRSVIPYFQPVVDLGDLSTLGYEVLGRSDVCGLETPDAMFQAASQLDLEIELSRMFRWEAVRASSGLPQSPHLFVNTHPNELSTPGLIDSMKSLRHFSPRQPITLEIHEAAVTDVQATNALRSALRDLGMQLAYDDFGAGQDRLIQLIEVPPDYLKFDMGLIRDIDRASAPRQKMLEALVKMVAELGIIPLAEGIETEAEGTVCRQIGFQLGQGFHYGRPARASGYESIWQRA